MDPNNDPIEIPIKITDLSSAQATLDQLGRSVQAAADKIASVGQGTVTAAGQAAEKVAAAMTKATKVAQVTQEEFDKAWAKSGAVIRGVEDQTVKSQDAMRAAAERHRRAIEALSAAQVKTGPLAQYPSAGLATLPPDLGGGAAKLPYPEAAKFSLEASKAAQSTAEVAKGWHASGIAIRFAGDTLNALNIAGHGWVMKLRAVAAGLEEITGKFGLIRGMMATGVTALAAAPVIYDIGKLTEIAKLSSDTAEMLKGTSESSIGKVVEMLKARKASGELTPAKADELLARAEALRRQVDVDNRGWLATFRDWNLKDSALGQFFAPQATQAARDRAAGVDPDAAKKRISEAAALSAEASRAETADFQTRQANALANARRVAEVNKAIIETRKEQDLAEHQRVLSDQFAETDAKVAALDRIRELTIYAINDTATREKAVIDQMTANAQAEIDRNPNDKTARARAQNELEEAHTKRVMLQVETGRKLNEVDAKTEEQRQRILEEGQRKEEARAQKELDDRIRAAERELSLKLEAVDINREAVREGIGMSDVQKRDAELEFLAKELQLINEQVEALKAKRLEIESDPTLRPEVREQRLRSMDGAISGLEGRGKSYGRDRAGIIARGDPRSVSDQMTIVFDNLERRLGTFAQNVARVFDSVIGGAIDGIQSSIMGLVKGTMDWGDALRNLTTTLLTSVVGAIAQMFATWIVKMTLVRGLESAFSSARKAETASELPGNVANAAAASGGSFGVSGYLGLAAFLALIGAAFAFGGAFAKGGKPPKKKMALVGEEGPELWVPDVDGTIIPADLTRQMMAGVVGSASTSRTAGTSRSSGGRSSRGGGATVVLVDDRTEAREHIASAPGAAQLRQLIRGELINLGLAS